MSLWVLRRNLENLQYNTSYGNPQNDLYRLFAQLFNGGLGEVRASLLRCATVHTEAAHVQTYDHSQLSGAFVTSDVNLIMDPHLVNASWNSGLFYNFTAYFVPGSLSSVRLAFDELMRVCQGNSWQLGTSGLYLSPFQWAPDSICLRSDCYKGGICIPRSVLSAGRRAGAHGRIAAARTPTRARAGPTSSTWTPRRPAVAARRRRA